MKECGLEADELSIYLKKESIKKENTIKKSQRVKAVRDALQRLVDKGLILYDTEKMSQSDSWIKSQMESLNEIFQYNGPAVRWDNGKYDTAYYLEYNLSKHRLIITLFTGKSTLSLSSKFAKFQSELELLDPDSQSYWHMRSYQFDYITRFEMYKEQLSKLSNTIFNGEKKNGILYCY